jgi:hypothetical protein
MRWKKLSSEMKALLFLAVVIFFPAGAAAQTANLVDQARKEGGEVVLYTTMPVTLFDIFHKAAKEKYPFLNIRHTYLSSSRQVSKVMLEHRAGKVQADVLGNSLEGMFYYNQALVQAGKIPLRKGVKTPAKNIDELLTGGNLHVIKPLGEYSDSMKLYRQLLGMKS